VVSRAPPPAHEQPRLPSIGTAAEFLSRGFDRNDLRDESGSPGFSPGTELLVTLEVVGVFWREWGRAGMLGLRVRGTWAKVQATGVGVKRGAGALEMRIA